MASADWQAEESKSSMLLNLKRRDKQKNQPRDAKCSVFRSMQFGLLLCLCNSIHFLVTCIQLREPGPSLLSQAIVCIYLFFNFGLTHCFAKKENVSTQTPWQLTSI